MIKSSLNILIILILLGSCNKVEIFENSDYNKISTSAKLALNSGNVKAIRKQYALLDNSEKQFLWETKWNSILEVDNHLLTLEQRRIILTLKGFVQKHPIEQLMKDPTEGELFISNNLSYFSKHFSTEQLFFLFECSWFCEGFSIFKASDYFKMIEAKKSLNQNTLQIEPFLEEDCECYYSIYCIMSIEGNNCATGECNQVSECGLSGTSNCTGLCK